MSNLHLLIVDDEPDSAEVVEMMLAPARIATTVVGDAYQAIEKLQEDPERYSAVIIDLALPGMDGFGLLNELRAAAATSDKPLIAITAYHTPELKARALKAGFNAYFPKPLDTTVFLGTLSRMFG
ncbi:MAG: response regulator [Anaerolineae bacterium]|nr:response regulator [Anaerolineae bacterium]NUQ05543.1 response regulator [Anaerolineae bacterium]